MKKENKILKIRERDLDLIIVLCLISGCLFTGVIFLLEQLLYF